MQPCLTETQRVLADLLEAIEARAAGIEPASTDRRSEQRTLARAECELHLFQGDDETEVVRDALARNITFMGLAAVARLPEPLSIGRPIEAVVFLPGHQQTHIAGTVAFCRDVEDECREVGISVKAAGAASILIHDVEAAKSMYDWFEKALQVPE